MGGLQNLHYSIFRDRIYCVLNRIRKFIDKFFFSFNFSQKGFAIHQDEFQLSLKDFLVAAPFIIAHFQFIDMVVALYSCWFIYFLNSGFRIEFNAELYLQFRSVFNHFFNGVLT